mmetsp:Transcript_37291/g.48230  ORF Transcript_37291/g.48230 Transcript_37291/m.48230 type:complete len:233 (+) Transcript_37291:1048-1746(+)
MHMPRIPRLFMCQTLQHEARNLKAMVPPLEAPQLVAQHHMANQVMIDMVVAMVVVVAMAVVVMMIEDMDVVAMMIEATADHHHMAAMIELRWAVEMVTIDLLMEVMTADPCLVMVLVTTLVLLRVLEAMAILTWAGVVLVMVAICVILTRLPWVEVNQLLMTKEMLQSFNTKLQNPLGEDLMTNKSEVHKQTRDKNNPLWQWNRPLKWYRNSLKEWRQVFKQKKRNLLTFGL